MSATHLPSDLRMRAERLAGRFICLCRVPIKVRVGVFDGFECRHCWRPIIAREQTVELIEHALDDAS